MMRYEAHAYAGKSIWGALKNAGTGHVLLHTTRGTYLSTAFGAVYLLHDMELGEISFGAAIPNSSEFLRAVRAEMLVKFEDARLEIPQASLALSIEPHARIVRSKKVRKYGWSDAHTKISALLKRNTVLPAHYCVPDNQSFEYGLFCKKADTAIAQLMEAPLEPLLTELLSNLLGLGRGLTPSGDDILCGLMALLLQARALGIYRNDKFCIQLTDCVSRLASQKTGSVSTAYLLCVAKGERLALLDSAVDAVLTEDDFSMLERLIGVGASSGTDMLYGIALGLSMMENNREKEESAQ